MSQPKTPLRIRLRATFVGAIKWLWMASPFSRPGFVNRIEKAIWYARMVRWRRGHDCPLPGEGRTVYAEALRTEGLSAAISYLEFGVFGGESLRWWLSENTDPASTFVGFDSFEGLPEQWRMHPKGHFATAAPEFDDPRCRLEVGLFQETLPGFLAGYSPGRVQVVFLDADLYSSTSFVLQQIGSYLRPGDVLLFDEFHDCMHEFRAFVDFLSSFPIEYQVLYRSGDWSQVAMRVLSNPYRRS